MYEVTQEYLDAIKLKTRKDHISGSISLSSGASVTISDSVLVSGTLKLTKELCGDKYRIGTFNLSCLRFSVFMDDALGTDLTGATVQLTYSVIGEDNTGGSVPLGTFFVDPILSSRRKNILSIVAYDAGVKAETEPSAELRAMSCTPAELIIAACEECGLDTTVTAHSLDDFPNSGVTVSAADKQIQSCRDIIMWCASLLCGYAVINRDMQLSVIPAKYSASGTTINADREIGADERKYISVTDTRSYIKYLTAYRGDSVAGYTSSYVPEDEQAAPAHYVLEKNPLISELSETDCDTANRAWHAYIDAFMQRGINARIFGDPAIDVGDTVMFRGGDVDQRGGVAGVVTSTVWNYRGAHDIFCSAAECTGSLLGDEGAELFSAGTRSQTAKRIDALEKSAGGVGENVGKHNERFNDYRTSSNRIVDNSPDNQWVNDYNHAEGYRNTITDSSYCHVEGSQNSVGSTCSNCFVSGNNNSVTNRASSDIVSGYKNTVSGGAQSVVLGQNHEVTNCGQSVVGGTHNTVSSTNGSLVMGERNTVSGSPLSVLAGTDNDLQVNNGKVIGAGMKNACTGGGDNSMFCGENNSITGNSSFTCGHHNVNNSGGILCGSYGTATYEMLAVGNGSSDNQRLIFFVVGTGDVYATGAFRSIGADYAEYFEWADGNPDNEDRCGMLVSLDGDRIVPAHGEDILGAVSAAPSVVGNDPQEWRGKYVRDVYGRAEPDSDGKGILTDEYDRYMEYLPRSKRPEWAAVGLVGRLIVRDNGTCQPGRYASARNGIASASLHETRARVLKRIDETHIEVLIK